MCAEERIRSFIAVELSAELRDALAEIQDRLRVEMPRLRWVKPGGIHLTVKFLGDVPPGKLHRIGEALSEWAGSFRPYRLAPMGLGVFPNLHRPRVIWVGFDAVPRDHGQIVETVESGLVSFGFPLERGPHVPHLTLARIRDSRDTRKLDRILEDFRQERLPVLEVNRITLFRSDLSREGARYTPLSQAELSAP